MINQRINPDDFEQEKTTVWDFPIRGNWATHKADYRGNFAPQIPRNIILNYSEEGDLILDPMVGSGTSLVEAKLLNRNAIGYDINPQAVDITKSRLEFEINNQSKQIASLCNAKCLQEEDNSVDLIVTHPPYLDLVSYSDGKIPEDLSNISNIPKFLDEFDFVITEMFRVLKPGRYCAVLIGDTRKGQHFIPLSHFVMLRCLYKGFTLKEEIIKTQHNTKHGPRWTASAKHYKFYLIMHEHLFVFRKPSADDDLSRIQFSSWKGYEKILP